MLGCPDATLLVSEEMALLWERMVNGALYVALSSDPDTIGHLGHLSSLGEEVVTQAMSLGHSGFSSLHGAIF